MTTIFESFFKMLIKERIDENNIPLSTFYKGEQTAPIALFDKLLSSKPRQITKGLIVSNNFNFANLNELNQIFLDMKLLPF